VVEFRLLICVCEAWQWNRMQNLRRVVKMQVELLLNRLWTEVHVILRRCRRLHVVCNVLVQLSISWFVRKTGYDPFRLPLSCEVVKKWLYGPWFESGGDGPHFGHAFSNRTYFRACCRFWWSSVQRAPKVAGEKKKIEDRMNERRIAQVHRRVCQAA